MANSDVPLKLMLPADNIYKVLFVNNTKNTVIVGYWVRRMEGLETLKDIVVKPKDMIFVKSTTGVCYIFDSEYYRIGEYYDKPTTYKQVYYNIWNEDYDCEYKEPGKVILSNK